MMIYALIKLSDNGKKALIVFFLIFIILFVLVGYISLAVEGIMKKQGAKADEMLANVVKAEYFEKEKPFMKFARKKNAKVLFNQSIVPFLVMLGAMLTYLLFCLFSGKWGYNPFNWNDGFGTLLFHFDKWPREKFFGINIINDWPSVIAKPHFEVKALFSYFFVPVFLVGAGWFLICTQCFIARTFRIRKIARGIYRKKLVPDEPAATSQPETKSEY